MTAPPARPARPRDVLTAIGTEPRPAGSVAESKARAHCAGVLRRAGFEVREEPFEYSVFPGRYATALGGLASTLTLLGGAMLAARGRPGQGLSLLLVGGGSIALAARWLARHGVLRASLMRRAGVNLVATRGASAPHVWLVAHIDSKSQPVPIVVRAGAIALHGAAWIAALVVCAGAWLGASLTPAWPWLAGAAIVTGLPVMASVVGENSAGAVDNASGATTVTCAAASIPRDVAVGVLLTSAEELGLAGARAWVASRAPAIALNCDGVDDVGQLLCMYSGRRPERLVGAFERAAHADGRTLSFRRLLPGVLVDGVAFADAGWEVLTLSKGTVRTLGRIHTARDNLDALTGAGVDEATPLLARVARDLA